MADQLKVIRYFTAEGANLEGWYFTVTNDINTRDSTPLAGGPNLGDAHRIILDANTPAGSVSGGGGNDEFLIHPTIAADIEIVDAAGVNTVIFGDPVNTVDGTVTLNVQSVEIKGFAVFEEAAIITFERVTSKTGSADVTETVTLRVTSISPVRNPDDYSTEFAYQSGVMSGRTFTAEELKAYLEGAPTFTLDPLTGTIAENSAGGVITLDAALAANDVDTDNSTLTYALVNAPAAFTIDPTTGVISTNASLNFEAAQTHEFEVRVTDSTNKSSTTTVIITVTNEDEGAASFELRSTGDVDAPAVGDTLSVARTADDPDGNGPLDPVYTWFRFDGTNETSITDDNDDPVMGSSYTLTDADETFKIRVRATYQDGGGKNESVPVDTAATVAEAPELVLPTLKYLTNATTPVASAADGWYLVTGDASTGYTIDPNNTTAIAPNSADAHRFILDGDTPTGALDGGAGDDEYYIAPTVNGDTTTTISVTDTQGNNKVIIGDTITTVNGTVTTEVSFALTGVVETTAEVSGATVTNHQLEFEVTTTTTDASVTPPTTTTSTPSTVHVVFREGVEFVFESGDFADRTFTFADLDGYLGTSDSGDDGAPTFTQDAYTAEVVEGVVPSAAIATVKAIDKDNDTITYSLDQASLGLGFVIDAGSGAITLTSALDHSAVQSATLTVTATAKGKTDTATVTVTVAQNLIPRITTTGITHTLTEGTEYSDEAIATIAATDNDIGDTIAGYDLDADAKALGFAIDENGALTFTGNLNYEAIPASDGGVITIAVTAIDSKGGTSTPVNVAVTVTNIEEGPTTFTLEISTGGDIANPRVGDTLTVTPDMEDPDGFTGEYTYTWWRKDSDGTNRVQITEPGTSNPITTASYTLGTDDEGKFVEAVVGDYRDDGNFNNTPDSSGLVTAKAVQEEANAAPTITTTGLTATIPEGSYDSGNDLAFFTLEVADTDGDTLTYDLDQASKNAGFSIAKNAEGNGVISYGRHVNFEELADGDKVVTITASVTDGKIATPLTAEITVTFEDVNEQTIFNLSGDTITPAVGDTLEITTSQDDPEGDDNVTYGYTWWRVNDAGAETQITNPVSGENITTASYTITGDDLGFVIRAKVADYTDDAGNPNMITDLLETSRAVINPLADGLTVPTAPVEVAHDSSGLIVLANYVEVNDLPVKIILTYTASDGTSASHTIGEDNATPPEHWAKFEPNYNAATDEILLDFSSNAEFVADVGALTPTGIEQTFTITVSQGDSRSFTDTVTLKLTGPDDVPDTTTPFVDSTGTAIDSMVSITEADLEAGTETGIETGTMFINDVDVGDTYEIKVGYTFTNGADTTTVAGTDRITIAEGETQTLDTTMGALEVTLNGKEITWTYTYDQNAGALASSGTPNEEFAFEVIDTIGATPTTASATAPLRFELVAATETPAFFDSTGMALTTLTGDANIARASGDVVATVLVEFSADDTATMLSETITLEGDDAALFNAAIAQEAGTTDNKVVTIGEKTYRKIEITWAGDDRTETAPSGGNTDDYFDFTITVTNSETSPASATLTARLARVDVALTNEAPVITSTGPFSFDEGDHSSGVVVTTLTYTDAESDVPEFRFVDTDNANALETSITIGGATFTITDGGEITVTGNFDADDETQPESYTLTVRATDSANNNASADVEITVNVQNIDDGDATYRVDEDGAMLTATLVTADPDGVKDGTTTTYQWFTTDGTTKTDIADADEQTFDSSTHTLPAGALFGVTVTYTDNVDDTAENVDAVQSPIRFTQDGNSITSYAVDVAEDRDTTPFVTFSNIVSTVGLKTGGIFTYSYVTGTPSDISNLFQLSSTGVFVGGLLDYETLPNSYTATIIVKYDEEGDGSGAIYTRELEMVVTVTDVVDTALFTLSSTGDIAAPESGDTLTIANSALDPDGTGGGATYAWYHVNDDGSETAITDDSGAVTGANYKLRDSDIGETVRVIATYTNSATETINVRTDTGAAVSAALITFSFTDGANNPATSSVDVPEDQSEAATFLTISGAVTNPPSSHTLTYAFAPDGNPDDTFAIDGTTGALSLATGKDLDYEVAPNSYTLTIRATYDVDGDTTTTDDQETRDVEITINVTDVDDTATFAFTSTNGGDVDAPAVGDKFVISQTGDDPDGHPAAPAGTIIYKWFYVDDAGVETPIVDGLGDQIEGNPYTIQTADVGKTIRARAEYMDGAGNMDSVPMDLGAPVASAPTIHLASDVIEIAHDTDSGEVVLATINGDARFTADIIISYTLSDGTKVEYEAGSNDSPDSEPAYWFTFEPRYNSTNGEVSFDFGGGFAELLTNDLAGPAAPTPGGVEQEFTIDVMVGGSSVAEKTVTVRITGPEDSPDATNPFVDNTGTAIAVSDTISETDLEAGTETGVRTGTMFINDVDEGETYGLTVSYAYSLDSDSTKDATGSVTLTEIMVDPTNANHEIKEDPDNAGIYIVVDRTTGATVMDQAGQPVVPDLTTARHVQGATLDTTMGKLVLTLDGKQIDWTYTYNQDAGDLADSGTSTEALTFTLTDAGATDPNPVTPLTFSLVAAAETAEFLQLTGTPAAITENVDYTTEAIIAAGDYTVTGATGAVSYTFVQSDGTEIGASDQGFTIAADGAITYTGTANYEALTGGVFTLYVKATDSASPAKTGQVTVSVSVVNVDEGAATVTLAVENDADANVLEVGERLLASVDYSTDGDVTDPATASPTYTWWRVDNAGTPTQITDAVGSSYTVTADDISYKIFARAEYTESDGTTMDSADSAQTIAVATTNAAPTITVSGTVAIDQGNYIGSQEQEITGFTIDVVDDNPADLTYTLIGTGSDLFRIDNSGKIYAIGDIAHADRASYTFQVQVDDGVNPAVPSTGSITININDNDREPELVGDLTGAVTDEDIVKADGIDTTGTITGIEDPDPDDTFPPASKLAYLIENGQGDFASLLALGLVDPAVDKDPEITEQHLTDEGIDPMDLGYADAATLVATGATEAQLEQIVKLSTQDIDSAIVIKDADGSIAIGSVKTGTYGHLLFTPGGGTGGGGGGFPFFPGAPAPTPSTDLGTWTYELNQDLPATRALKAGETVQDIFTLVYTIPAVVDTNGVEVIAAKSYETDVVISVTGADISFTFVQRADGYSFAVNENFKGDIPVRDSDGNIILARDEDGNIIQDQNGNDVPVIAQVEANDPDADTPVRVRYEFSQATLNNMPEFEDDSGNMVDLFSINATTGVITLNNELDYETNTWPENEYELTVLARDLDAPSSDPRSTSTTVTVRLLDVNDAPVFAEDSYTAAAVAENVDTGTVLYDFKARSTADNGDVTTLLTDEDSHQREFTYSITSGNPVVGTRNVNGVDEDIYLFGLRAYSDPIPDVNDPNFDINDYPGFDINNPGAYIPPNYGFEVVLLNDGLDYETAQSHTLTVQVRDSRDPDTSIGATDTVEIVIPVTDITQDLEFTGDLTGEVTDDVDATVAPISGTIMGISDLEGSAVAPTGGTIKVSGAINTDPNQPNDHTYKGQYGTLTFTPSTAQDALAGAGSWSYTLDSTDTQTQALGSGDTETDTFILTYTQGTGQSAVTHTGRIVISVTGDNNPVYFVDTDNRQALQDGEGYTANVLENTLASTVIETVEAIDPEGGDAAYSITGGNVQVDDGNGGLIDLFTINTVDIDPDPITSKYVGQIVLNKQVDFDTLTQTSYTLEITGSLANNANPDEEKTVEVEINFRDVNDIVPVLSAVGDKDDVNLGEGQAGVKTGISVEIADADTNNNFDFDIAAGDGSTTSAATAAKFTLVEDTAVTGGRTYILKLDEGKQLDFDVDGSTIELDIQLNDGEADSNILPVTITVIEAPQTDTPPTITVSGSGSVVEGDYTTSESSAVITGFNIVGYDEEGHDLSYSLTGTGAELFAINSNNKQITAIGALDYDNGAKSYALNVIVTANGLSTTSTDTITITVTDKDDEAPSFGAFDTARIAENADADGTEIIKLTAADDDTVSGDLRFAILDGNTVTKDSLEVEVFAIDEVSGVITLKEAGLLDHETKGEFKLTVGVTDGRVDDADNPIYTTGELTITVTNFDEEPEFTGDLTKQVADNVALPAEEAITITGAITGLVDPEGDAIPTGGTVTVKTEQGTYGTLTFAADDSSGAADGAGTWTYTLDRTSDATKALAAGDVETDSFTLVYTEGSNSYETDIVISVTGGNNAVEFDADSYGPFQVPENLGLAVDAARTVTATDPEGETVSYSISATYDDGGSPVDASSLFQIDADGAITLTRLLDRETDPARYELTVTAGILDNNGVLQETDTATIIYDVFDHDETPGLNAVGDDLTGDVRTGTDGAEVTDIRFTISDKDEIDPHAFVISARGATTAETAAKFDVVEDSANPGQYILKVEDGERLALNTGDEILLDVQVHDDADVPSAGKYSNTIELTLTVLADEDTNDTAPTFAEVSYDRSIDEVADVTADGAMHGTIIISADGREWSYVLDNALTEGDSITETITFTVDGTPSADTLDLVIEHLAGGDYSYSINGGDAVNLGTDYTAAITGDTGTSDVGAPVTADDPDIGALTYSLSGAGNELFEVDANGQISVVGALDFETTPTYTLTLTASDGENTPDATTTVTINVLDVDETPDTDATFAIVSVGGHADPRADEELRVEIDAEDPNGGVDTSTISYAWYAEGDTANVLSSVATFTPTAAGSYYARVKYQDGNANPEATVNTPAITVAAANQAPTITDPLAASIDAGDYTSATGTVSVDYGVSDAEGDTLTYAFFVNSALTQDNQGFTINSDSGAITFTGSALAHGDNDVILVVQVSDDRGGTAQSTVTVNVASVSAPPVFGANAVAWETGYENGAVDEDVALSTVLATITATDPESDTLTYRVKVGSGDALFEMVGDKLQIKAALDFETAQTHAVIVEVSDDGGASYDAETTVTITVGDVDEAPTFAQDTFTFDVVKGDDLRGFMQTIMATDPEGVTDLTYALVGNGATGFSIDDETGEITVNRDILARDQDRTYRFSVEATDATDNTGSTDITVNVKSGPSVITITGEDNNSDKNDLVDILADWTLTAKVGTDADGVDDAQPKTFFWYHVGDDPSVIPTTAITGSGNQATYVTTAADVGETIAVRYTYTDGDGNVQNVYADVGMPVRKAYDFGGENPDDDNDIDLTNEPDPIRVDAGDGSDTITDSQHDDLIIGGLGDDDIDLGTNDDKDTVVYGIGGQTAQDGGDDITNFKRGQDKFIFSFKSDITGVSAINDLDSLLHFITKGDDDLANDEFLVHFDFDFSGGGVSLDGVNFHFTDSVYFSGGRISMPIVEIDFAESIDGADTIANEIFGGMENLKASVDPRAGILTDFEYLNILLGGDDEFEAIGYQIIDIT